MSGGDPYRLRALQGTLGLIDGVEVHLPHAPRALCEQDLVGSAPADEQRVRDEACGSHGSTCCLRTKSMPQDIDSKY